VETISAREILEGPSSPSEVSAVVPRVAFIGASDPDTTSFPDGFPSFFQGASESEISGVELVATAYLNLLHGERLERVPVEWSIGIIVLFAFALAIFAAIAGRWSILGVVLAIVLYGLAGLILFVKYRVLSPLGIPILIVGPIMLLVAISIRYRFARALILHLMPRPVARRILVSSTDERGRTVSDEATVLFFDLIGSSAIAEKISALEFSKLLNGYHETVSRNIATHRGYVSAFAGDGVIAVFTKADAGPDHARQACRSVIAILEELRRPNAEWHGSGSPELSLRIGVNSGAVAAGEIGGLDRFNFSVVGDVVNLAARLEQMGKTLFPGEKDVVLVGELTRRLAGGELNFLDCGTCSIPGRAGPEHIYRLVPDDT
jgi:adenylate cyclase